MGKSIRLLIALFTVKINKGLIYTLGHKHKLSILDKYYFVQYINDVLYFKTDEYKASTIIEVIISFGIRKGAVEQHKLLDMPKNDKPSGITSTFQNYRHFKLPLIMDLLKYGILKHHGTNLYVCQITSLTDAIISIVKIDKGQTFNKVQIFKNGNPIIDYVGSYLDSHTIMRQIGENLF